MTEQQKQIWESLREIRAEINRRKGLREMVKKLDKVVLYIGLLEDIALQKNQKNA